MIGSLLLSLVVVPSTATLKSVDALMPMLVTRGAKAPFAVQGQKVEISVSPDEAATVNGETVFTVKVTAKNPVNSVEFYVGSDLMETDTSTPYEFKIDTLNYADGPLKLTFGAYTTEGENAKKTINVNVDNGLTKGADFHVAAGNDFLAVAKFDDALRCGRTALKIQPGHNPARLLMARAFRGKGVLDSAQKFAEDALAADPNFFEAADTLSAINLVRAFSTFNRGGAREETLATIRKAMSQAVKNRRLVLDSGLDKMGAPNETNRLAIADAAIRAGRFSVAISATLDGFRKNPADSTFANRLAYAQLRAGRLDDAQTTLNELKRANGMDGYSFALQAIVDLLKGRDAQSDEAMKEAMLNEPDNLGIQTAQAWIAIKRNRSDVLRSLVTRLSKDQGQRTEVNYYLAYLYNAVGQYADAAKAFEAAVLAEPTNDAMYVQRGNDALAVVVAGRVEAKELDYQAKVARVFYDTALEARVESAEALTGIALVSVFSKNVPEAATFARAAVGAGAGYAPAHYVQAMVYARMENTLKAAAEKIRNDARGGAISPEQRDQMNKLMADANNYGRESVAAMRRAEALDPGQLGGRGIPDQNVAFSYFSRHGRLPLLIAPK